MSLLLSFSRPGTWRVGLWMLLLSSPLSGGDAPPPGKITGRVPTPASTRVTLHDASGATVSTRTTAADGQFAFTGLPPGTYEVRAEASGAEPVASRVSIAAGAAAVDVGTLGRSGDRPLQMQSFEVAARQEATYQALDRKVYLVGKDVLSATGSASDLLQNVPSVQVDVDGNVSLRGDSGVEILINGKPSVMMRGDRAAALERLSAGEIERVEVITNPSARFRPDGTAGIINLVMKTERPPGYTADLRVNAGNDERFQAGLTGSYTPGRYTLHGSLYVRRDSRPRLSDEVRRRYDEQGALRDETFRQASQTERPLSRRARLGAEFRPDRHTKLGVTVQVDDEKATSRRIQTHRVRNAAGDVIRDEERVTTAPELEDEVEVDLEFERALGGDDHELSAVLRHGRSEELENEWSATRGLRPGNEADAQYRRVFSEDIDTDFSLDYVRPAGGEGRIELGYEMEREQSLSDLRAESQAEAGIWLPDARDTNRFRADGYLHSLYATYGRPFGRFGFLGGFRAELTDIETRQETTGEAHRNRYDRFYPSLHLTHRPADGHEFQLSYSHRVRRPDGDDLNPFLRYDDPFSAEAGNPELEPEDVHSVEFGYQFDHDDTTLLAAIYARQRENGITEVSRFLDNGVLLTTEANLGRSRSGGVELGATTRLWDRLALNFSANGYRQQLATEGLGLASRSGFGWEAKLTTTWDATDRLMVQATHAYTAARLTAQGERHPYHVTNFGLRYSLRSAPMAFVLTVSDVFNTLRLRTTLDTPTLQGELERRRSSRIVYAGITYRFGAGKRERERIEFDESL